METDENVKKLKDLQMVLTVPMRNGNTIKLSITLLNMSSYRTYEEWKQMYSIHRHERIKSSYRTYEEWKQITTRPVNNTYYEVLTVPMRNGNHQTILQTYQFLTVLTVPMRNGN